jgi:hypothetical protein
MSAIDIIPNREDLFSAAFAAAGSFLMKSGSPGMEAAEQLASVLIARNLAAGINSTDSAEGMTLKEHDLYTAGIRAGVSLFQKGGQNQVMYSAFNGIASNVLARFLNTRVVPNA